MKPLNILSIVTLTFIIGLGCTKDFPTITALPTPPLINIPDSLTPAFTQQLYDLACKVCRNHMYHPETAVFRPLDESHVAVTSEGLFIVITTVVGDDQNGQEVTSGFVALFQIYRGQPMINSFMSWRWENRPLFKPSE